MISWCSSLQKILGHVKNYIWTWEVYFKSLRSIRANLYSSTGGPLNPGSFHYSSWTFGRVWHLSTINSRYHEDKIVSRGVSSCSLLVEPQPRSTCLKACSRCWGRSNLQSTFSRVLRISTTTPPSVADHSAMATSVSHGDTEGRPRWQHCGKSGHCSKKCWNKFGKPQ